MHKSMGVWMKLGRLGLCLVLLVISYSTPAPPAFAAPGALDVTFAGFGVNGTVISTGVEGAAFAVALQPDGKIVTAGCSDNNLLVMRHLSNGAPDTSFSEDGVATFPNALFELCGRAVAIQGDGKIVVAGAIFTSPSDFMLARLTSSGALDATFGNGGFVTTDFDNDQGQAFDVLIQPNGQIVACGIAEIGGDNDFAAARYNSDGSLDTAFGGDGTVSIGFGGDEACHNMALQSDDRLVLTGDSLDGFDADLAVARLNGDGSVDVSFDHDGKATAGFGGFDLGGYVAIQADGDILVAGSGDNKVLLARYLPDGSLDTSLDGDGKISVDLSVTVSDAALQPDNKLVLVGHHASPDGDVKVAVVRLNTDGLLDIAFGGTGSGFYDIGGDNDGGLAVALEPDGRIITAGFTDAQPALIRLWPDGLRDAGGQQTLGFDDPLLGPGSSETAYAMAVQGDGKLILAGEAFNTTHTESDLALARFNSDGQLDTTFGEEGRVVFGFGLHNGAHALALQADGKIVAAGQTQSASTNDFLVARFNPDGTPDGTFALFGFNVVDFLGGDDSGTAVALAPDGKIVVAGTAFNGARIVFGVARFNSDGTLDTTFDSDGKQLVEFLAGLSHAANAVVVQPDGKIVVAGTVGGDFALLRLNQNGSLDSTFGLSGLIRTDMGGDDSLNALVALESGGFVAAGARVVSGSSEFALAQYKSNGTLVGCPPFTCRTWPTGKAFVNSFVNFGSAAAFAIDARSDGRVAAAGCAGGQLVWAQLQISTLNDVPITGVTNFAGDGECALGAKYVGLNQLVMAGRQSFNGNDSFALARFETTALPAASAFQLHLPLVMH